MSIGVRMWHCWTVDCPRKSWSVIHIGKTDPELLTGTRKGVTGKRGDCMHMGAGLENSVLMNSKCQGFMSLSKWSMGSFYVLFLWEEFVWMSILYHKGIALLMLSLLWLIEKLQTYWMKNLISSRLWALSTNNQRKHCKSRKYRKQYWLAHPRLLLACQGCSEIWPVSGDVFCHSLGKKYQHTVLVSHFQRSPDL